MSGDYGGHASGPPNSMAAPDTDTLDHRGGLEDTEIPMFDIRNSWITSSGASAFTNESHIVAINGMSDRGVSPDITGLQMESVDYPTVAVGQPEEDFLNSSTSMLFQTGNRSPVFIGSSWLEWDELDRPTLSPSANDHQLLFDTDTGHAIHSAQQVQGDPVQATDTVFGGVDAQFVSNQAQAHLAESQDHVGKSAPLYKHMAYGRGSQMNQMSMLALQSSGFGPFESSMQSPQRHDAGSTTHHTKLAQYDQTDSLDRMDSQAGSSSISMSISYPTQTNTTEASFVDDSCGMSNSLATLKPQPSLWRPASSKASEEYFGVEMDPRVIGSDGYPHNLQSEVEYNLGLVDSFPGPEAHNMSFASKSPLRMPVDTSASAHTLSSAPPSMNEGSTNGSEVVMCGVGDCTILFRGKYRSGNRSRHRRLKHGPQEQVFECGVGNCEKIYHRKDARKKHYRSQHPRYRPAY